MSDAVDQTIEPCRPAEVVWTEPAFNDLQTMAEYIDVHNPEAARRLVHKVFRRVKQLRDHPRLGSQPNDLDGTPYCQIVEPSCRVRYRYDGVKVLVLHVMRTRQLLRPEVLSEREDQSGE